MSQKVSVAGICAIDVAWSSNALYFFYRADVMGDSIVVRFLRFSTCSTVDIIPSSSHFRSRTTFEQAEKARLEPESRKGQLQSTCYASRFFGIMIAAPVSTYLYSGYGPGPVVILLACAPLPIIPLLYLFSEDRMRQVQSTKDQCIEIWNTVCCRAVWQPLGFLFLYNLLQVQNSAWRQYLKTVLGFTAQELNSLLVASYIFLFIGTIAYKYFFLQASWRRVYQFCILINGLLTATQLLLIRQKTFGISNFWFSLGDDAAQEFISGVQFLVRLKVEKTPMIYLVQSHACLFHLAWIDHDGKSVSTWQ